MTDTFNYQASESDKNIRLDVFLGKTVEGASRSFIQKLISSADITVNDKPVKANYKININDNIKVNIPPPQVLELVPEDIPLDILYEDEHIIVINKQRGMVVHPAVGNYHGTLVNALLKHCEDLSGINGVIRPGIVHRLDKDTSGVMVAAKNDQAHLNLAKQIKEHTASRRYMAILHGNLQASTGVVNAPIGRHPVDRKKMAVTFNNSKEAITNFTVLERFGNYTLVECKLLTGRTHQIRVHMAHIGHPVVGDPKYGPSRPHFNICGQALHSAHLTLRHPETADIMVFSAPMPSDMQDILDLLNNKVR
ncbi:Ribosomal large subunit pseudouridine synthase D [bioreactor metagenome]|uniref:Ribosomal large subunit pseudouridine synthase D n=1 Tax=bioreactor metagenome TaxID=1076179 RepID=A0A644T2P2_9ZZZZ|nr:RluA family pseudouridine synthase [Negativicutes bacterium]